MELTLDSAKAALRSQPFSVLLNAEITSFGPTSVELRVPITDQVKQQHGFVHGGVVSYAADNALTFAGGLELGPAPCPAPYLRRWRAEMALRQAMAL